MRSGTALGLAGVSLLIAPAVWSQSQPSVGRVIVVVTGLRNDSGSIRVGLYSQPSRWPRANQEWRACFARISGRRASCEIDSVGPNTYAIAFTHDENNNAHFDQGFLGWPLEGYGFSNNARPRMLSAPSWESARFAYAGGAPITVAMTVQY